MHLTHGNSAVGMVCSTCDIGSSLLAIWASRRSSSLLWRERKLGLTCLQQQSLLCRWSQSSGWLPKDRKCFRNTEQSQQSLLAMAGRYSRQNRHAESPP